MKTNAPGPGTNWVKTKLSAGKTVVGTWSILGAPALTEICAYAGLDFLMLDLEHGSFTVPVIESCIRAAEAAGCSPLVRIPKGGDPILQNLLDLGAHGIVVPQLADCAAAKSALEALLFPPEGRRGYNPFTRAGQYEGAANGIPARLQNGFALNTLLIETLGAYKELDQILQLPGLDVLYLGAYDMSLALGCPGNFEHPEMLKFIETSVKKIRAAGKTAGAIFKTEAEMKRLTGLGVNFLVYGVDSWVYRNAMAAPVKMLRALQPQ